MDNVLDLLQMVYDFIYQLFITVLDYFPIGEAVIPFGTSEYSLSIVIASLMSILTSLVLLSIPFLIIRYIIKLLKGRVRT